VCYNVRMKRKASTACPAPQDVVPTTSEEAKSWLINHGTKKQILQVNPTANSKYSKAELISSFKINPFYSFSLGLIQQFATQRIEKAANKQSERLRRLNNLFLRDYLQPGKYIAVLLESMCFYKWGAYHTSLTRVKHHAQAIQLEICQKTSFDSSPCHISGKPVDQYQRAYYEWPTPDAIDFQTNTLQLRCAFSPIPPDEMFLSQEKDSVFRMENAAICVTWNAPLYFHIQELRHKLPIELMRITLFYLYDHVPYELCM